MYKLLNNLDGIPYAVFRSNTDGNGGIGIPFNPDNLDYQEYLKWVEVGNTPEPADE